MRFRVLGPLEIEGDDGLVRLPAARTRTLATALVSRPNGVVSVDQLIDVVWWGEDPPRTAAKTLQTYVSDLRRALGDESRVTTRAPGYVLRVDQGELDSQVFESLLAAATSAAARDETVDALERLSSALALWRGRPYEEVADSPFFAADAARLEELRLVAVEDRIHAAMELGQHRSVIGDLEALVGEHPMRERLWGLLMLALYRCGRQADALAAFQRARRTLVNELGIDPGVDLRRLEQAILAHDPTLDSPLPERSPRAAPAAMAMPPTRYAACGELHLAYQLLGDGPIDVLFADNFASHVEAVWEYPPAAAFLRRLASFARLIKFDCRGTGLSDPVDRTDRPTLEQWVDDALAVLDTVGSERPALFGWHTGAAMCVMLAATFPERARSLVLHNPALHSVGSVPGDLGFEEVVNRIASRWGTGPGLVELVPGIDRDPELSAWFGRYQRLSLSPGRVAARLRMNFGIDVADIASSVETPTLVLHRSGNRLVPLEQARELAGLLRDCRLVEVPGDAHLWMVGDLQSEADEIERFLEATAPVVGSDRVLATVMLARLVGTGHAVGATSTADPARTEAGLRRQVERYRGEQATVAGYDFAYTFDGPARAIGCALAVVDTIRSMGSEVGVGLHTGEVERNGAELGGVALDVAGQACRIAGPNEVLVSRTVVDLVAGSGLAFRERAELELAALPGTWKVFAVEA